MVLEKSLENTMDSKGFQQRRPEVYKTTGKITKLHLTFFGQDAMMLSIVSGKRKRGRQKTRWLDIIRSDTDLGTEQQKNKVEDQKAWRELAHWIIGYD